MAEWWNELTTVNRVFYGAALFFSVIFLWQFIASLIGMAGGEGDVEVDTDIDSDIDLDHDIDLDDIEAHSLEDAAETIVSFKLLSLRAIMAFFTLFTWANALYIDTGKSLSESMVLGALWGLGGWLAVTVIINLMRKMTETGNLQISSCVGSPASVYMDIPAKGTGKIRVAVSGVVSMVAARSNDGGEIKSGTPVRVSKLLDGMTVEVEVCNTQST